MQMVNTLINGEYELLLPDHRAARPEWKLENGGWEVKRIEAMIDEINAFQFGYKTNRFPIVFDIGTEEGDISALLAKYTPCEIVLFEPNNRVWSCIRAIWEANDLPGPLDFYSGFLSNESKVADQIHWDSIHSDIVPDHGFKQLYEKYPDVPQVKMDDWCMAKGIYPDVITMDVEGSEFEVVKGAEAVLRKLRPVIFMSVHPVFMKEHYNQEVGVLLKFMHDIGYRHEVIELDYHEFHIKFSPK